ncbi:PAS domain S-box protein [Rapidithrix thailandica]|uniref:histidine kinase n=1 Tax=Rapidithrix thailandica TaxID=413964 RepID=A0AAW9S7J4_9BACT
MKNTENQILTPLIDSLTHGVCLKNASGEIILVNEAFCQLYGYTREEIVGKPFSLYINSCEAASPTSLHLQQFTNASLLGKPCHMAVKKGGSLFYVEVRKKCYSEKGKEDLELIEVHERPAPYLLAPLNREDALLQNIADVVFIHNFQGQFKLFYNNSEDALFPPTHTVGKSIKHLPLPASALQKLILAHGLSIQTGKTQNFEIKVEQPTGIHFYNVKVIPNNHQEVLTLFHNQTHLKSWQTEALKTKTHYKVVTENIREIISIYNLSGKMEYISPSVYDTLGYTDEELLHSPGLICIHPQDLWPLKELGLNIAQRNISSGSIQYQIKDKFGRYRWFESLFKPDKKEGKVNKIIVISHDITQLKSIEKKERKSRIKQEVIQEELLKNHFELVERHVSERQLNQEIQLSKERYELMLDSVTDAIWVFDFQWKVKLCNSAAHKNLQLPKNEITHQTFQELFPDKLDSPLYIGYQLVMKNRATTTVTYKDIRKGKTHWYQAQIYPVKDGILSITTEVTYRKVAEQKLKESEEKYRLLSENSRDLICLHDTDGTFLYITPSVKEILGYDAKELLGTLPLAIIHREDYQAKVQGSASKILQGQINEKLEYRIRKKDGSYVYFETNMQPIFNTSGVLIRLQSTSRDITARKLAEEKIIAKNRELEKANKELDQFVYSASHNLRAPLSSILGLINITKLSFQDEGVLEYFQMMEKSIRKLDETIHEINDYSKNNRVEIRVEKVDFEALVTQSIEDLFYLEELKRIKFSTNIQCDTPFFSDRNRLQVVLTNILSNAVKYQNLDQTHPQINIDIKASNQQVFIKVKDNGIGISPNYQEKVFNMFFRATDKASGSGLGLYIVKETINKLKGTIHICSKEYVGTEVSIWLPSTDLVKQKEQGL